MIKYYNVSELVETDTQNQFRNSKNRYSTFLRNVKIFSNYTVHKLKYHQHLKNTRHEKLRTYQDLVTYEKGISGFWLPLPPTRFCTQFSVNSRSCTTITNTCICLLSWRRLTYLKPLKTSSLRFVHCCRHHTAVHETEDVAHVPEHETGKAWPCKFKNSVLLCSVEKMPSSTVVNLHAGHSTTERTCWRDATVWMYTVF